MTLGISNTLMTLTRLNADYQKQFEEFETKPLLFR